MADGPVRFVNPYLAPLIARSPIADKTMRDWMKSADEYVDHGDTHCKTPEAVSYIRKAAMRTK